MTRIGTLLLVLLLAGLGGVAAREWPDAKPGKTTPTASAPAPSAPVTAGGPVGRDARGEVAAILGRPLFEPSRRPARPALAAAAAPNVLPRLTAVVVSLRGKSVIFAGVDGGKPLSVAEGGHIGGYVVQSIGAGQATLMGPDGLHVLRPSFLAAAASPPPSAVPAAPGPSLLDLLRNQPPSVGIPGLPAPAPSQ